MCIRNFAQRLHMQKPAIFRMLEYSQPFHICIPEHIQNPIIFTKIAKACVTLEIQHRGVLTILEYSES